MFKPTVPPEWEERLSKESTSRLPRFFIYAKDKTPHQCEPANGSCVNRLFDKIQSYKFDFQMKQLGKFDYHKLMHDQDLVIGPAEEKLIRHYQKIVQKIGDRSIGITDEKDRYVEIIKSLRKEMAAYGDEVYVADVLVAYFFGVKRTIHKAVLWEAYGSVIYQNLLDNKAGVQKMCMRCGNRFTPMYQNQCLCDECAREGQQVPEEIPEAYCIDCGRLFQPTSLRQTRCTVCQWLVDNPPVFAGPDEVVDHCSVCGGAFTVRSKGRGRKQKVCDRCRDEAKKSRQRDWVSKKRSTWC